MKIFLTCLALVTTFAATSAFGHELSLINHTGDRMACVAEIVHDDGDRYPYPHRFILSPHQRYVIIDSSSYNCEAFKRITCTSESDGTTWHDHWKNSWYNTNKVDLGVAGKVQYSQFFCHDGTF